MPTLTDYTLALLGTQTADAAFENLHTRGTHGKFARKLALKDVLKLDGRIPLERGETFHGSAFIDSDENLMPLALTHTVKGPELRIATGILHEDKTKWAGRNFGNTALLDDQGIGRLRAATDEMRAAGEAGLTRYDDLVKRSDALDVRIRDLRRKQYPNLDKQDAEELDALDRRVEHTTYLLKSAIESQHDQTISELDPAARAQWDRDQAEIDRLENASKDAYDFDIKPHDAVDWTFNQNESKTELTPATLKQLADLLDTEGDQTAAALHEFCRTPLHPGPCEGWKLAQAAGRDHTVRHDDLVAEKRARKRVAKPKTLKSAAPAAVSSEIPAPNGAGVQHEPLPIPDHVPVPPGVAAARERQANIDHARARADLLAELEEVAVLNEAPPDVIVHRAEQTARRLGIADAPELAPVLEAARSGDPDQIQQAIAAAAAKLGLHRLDEGRMVPYDRSRHKNLGTGGRPGQMMHVVRPGYAATLPGGERVQLEKTVVEEATPQEVIAERARIAPAAIATPPVKGRLKPSEILARARAQGSQTASVDEVNLYRQGMPNLTGFTLAEFGKLTGEALADFNKKHIGSRQGCQRYEESPGCRMINVTFGKGQS